MRYLIGRLAQAVLVLWAAYTATFFLLSVMPGDGIMIKFENPEMGLSTDQIEQIREYYRVDDPVLLQYLHAIVGTVQGDFGFSITNAVPVADRLAAALPQTIELAVLAFLLALVIAAGITAASTFAPFAWLRNALDAVPSILISIPVFWLGLVLIQVFSFQLGWVPMIGATPTQALILPVIALAIPISAPLAQVFCRSLDEVSTRPFVQVVTAKGAGRSWILLRHTAKNALLPTLTISALVLGELIAGSVVTETVFGRNGIGRLVNDSVAGQDLPVIQAVVLLAALAFVTVNLVVDLVFPLLDPRLRTTRARTPRRARAIETAVEPTGAA
jgi:peptide/nickel transport system permease protein